MKLLVIDVGNTSTAVGVWDDGRVGSVRHYDGTPDSRLKRVAKTLRAEGYDGVAYSSVVPKADAGWRAWAKSAGLRMHKVSYRDFTLKADYPKPSTIGSDRLADAAAAVDRFGAPVLVMDFGTALTAAVVTRDRVWQGGVIAPGFPLMRDYLFERAAKLPRMKIGSGVAPRIGKSTEAAMLFGALVGYRGMVREIVTQLGRNFKEDFKLVATGGFAGWVLKGVDLPFCIDENLTLYGVGLLCAKSFRD